MGKANNTQAKSKFKSPDLRSSKGFFKKPSDIINNTVEVKEVINDKFAKDTKAEFEYYLQNFGGSFNPGYGYDDIFSSIENKQGWQKLWTVI